MKKRPSIALLTALLAVVFAALAYAEAQGLSEEEAVRLSTAAGAANVMCSGTQAAEREAVEALLPKVRFSRLRP